MQVFFLNCVLHCSSSVAQQSARRVAWKNVNLFIDESDYYF